MSNKWPISSANTSEGSGSGTSGGTSIWEDSNSSKYSEHGSSRLMSFCLFLCIDVYVNQSSLYTPLYQRRSPIKVPYVFHYVGILAYCI